MYEESSSQMAFPKNYYFDEYTATEDTSLNIKVLNSLFAVAPHKTEWIILGISLGERISNTWNQQQSRVKGIIDVIKKGKHKQARHVSRLRDNSWAIRVTVWTSGQRKSTIGRQKVRLRHDLTRYNGGTLPSMAKYVVNANQGGIPPTGGRRIWIGLVS